MKKITKVVIPAAGFGTRFLPQTKAMPKEMLPVVDKPVIQYVVEEAIDSNVKNIIIITGSNKRAIEDHFDAPSEDLVKNLIQGKKEHLLKEIQRISNMANFIYIRQKGPYGNGTPVLTAEPAIEDEPFAVLWGDEFIYSKPPRLAQMIKVYEKFGGIVISGVKIENKEDLKKYGIADITHVENNVYKINKIVEKPEPDKAPSDIATHGGYILPPEIFSALKKTQPGRGGEIWLVDAINLLMKEGIPIYTVVIENGKYYDTGDKFEYLKTVIEFALEHEEMNGEFKTFIKSLKI
ncbi:UTP--glucose-1-phosphate uridylyltransferase [Candidatus Roizmanbacteria bacterium CG_4_9_14_3_um_filter_33_18]|uniref:UTP--glucose-1-phosphate uridylyltransferase n=2 Tax=Candidatus Roizmaniibacteriota TaxID=1752723 RepID=A0A2M7U6U5_9BACT|nr:MAG: UTP--glucose-1-phosphate uridylyltransferase [Candidatus Roizmanbacteria bacterium CG_4_10_14_0_2_um_filter_33_96]PJA55759.1 MAG: UTP--glucose-1-phosphate uridylyltransferase [Candidatus Roizmanbacteria bacterium CG_4_9_14_3_um_filter_33_18]